MSIDSTKYLPKSMRAMYCAMPEIGEPFAWAPLRRPIEQCTIALMTSAGIYLKDTQLPFDEEGERRDPTWGDPTYRVIPSDVRQDQIGCSHLHINQHDLLEDVNVVLPLRAFKQLAAEGAIGAIAEKNYSFMGYQQSNLESWRTKQGPELAARLSERGVDVLLLAPS